jgi:hypothetical protein
MSRHSERHQLRRKSRRRIADKTSDAIMEIYERGKQGGTDSLITSDAATINKVLAQAQGRRERRAKVRTLKPRVKGIAVRATPPKTQDYRKLPGGQIVGHPLPMRTVKQEARQSRLRRRDAMRRAA